MPYGFHVAWFENALLKTHRARDTFFVLFSASQETYFRVKTGNATHQTIRTMGKNGAKRY
jgi:hypothetical protein